jgi:hypothetical protein
VGLCKQDPESAIANCKFFFPFFFFFFLFFENLFLFLFLQCVSIVTLVVIIIALALARSGGRRPGVEKTECAIENGELAAEHEGGMPRTRGVLATGRGVRNVCELWPSCNLGPDPGPRGLDRRRVGPRRDPHRVHVAAFRVLGRSEGEGVNCIFLHCN